MLTRWDPFQEMMNLRTTVDRLFEGAYGQSNLTTQAANWGLALDVIEDDDAFVVKASVPGINPDDLEITFNDNTLTIKGEVKAEEEIKEAHYHLRERRIGTFSRSLSLGSRVNANAIDASYENGVLTLRLPKAEEIKPKRIAIQVSKMIEGKANNPAKK